MRFTFYLLINNYVELIIIIYLFPFSVLMSFNFVYWFFFKLFLYFISTIIYVYYLHFSAKIYSNMKQMKHIHGDEACSRKLFCTPNSTNL